MGRTADPGGAVVGAAEMPERYRMLRRVAHGGTASVWLAHDRALGRRVAIKLLSERFAHAPAAVRRFKREARAAAALSGHPHVMTIYDVGETAPPEGAPAGRGFIVMEYLAGGTVADALRLGTVTRADAIRWLHQAAEALDDAHRHGVLHRDIKLANLLLDRARVLHVGDFGIARLGAEDTITTSGQVIGTAAYLAPERALGHAATEASDRYSLAVAAYELLVGGRPFSAEHFSVLARQHLEQEAPRPSERNRTLPAAVDDVLARGMAKRPDERWPSASAFADAVEAALARPGRSAHSTPFPPTEPTAVAEPPAENSGERAVAGGLDDRPATVHRDTHRRRTLALAALAAAVLLALAIAAAAGVFHSGGHQRAGASARPGAPPAPPPAAHRAAPRHRTASGASLHQTAAALRPVAGSASSASGAGASADALDTRGHALMLAGDYAAAIPVLREAVATASPGSLTYAYALFDLGRSLRLAGDPQAATAVLRERLRIPNQTDVVRRELALAETAARHRR